MARGQRGPELRRWPRAAAALEGAVPAAGAGQPCPGRAPPAGTASCPHLPRARPGWGSSAGCPPEGLRERRGSPRPACSGATAPAQRAPELPRTSRKREPSGALFTHFIRMRTPTEMIVGLVLCPCGLLLTLTGTLAPNWRQVSLIPNQPVDVVWEQGIWDTCREQQSTHDRLCGQADELGYFEQVPVRVAQGLMPSALVVTVVGLVVAALGVRCWQPEPRHLVAGVSGLVLLLSGLMSLVPSSWYTQELWALPAPSGSTLTVGYSLVLSYLGSCLEILGGVALALSFYHCYKERRAPKLPPTPVTEAGSCSSRAYNNPWDVLADEQDGQHWRSRPPCDSDL